MLKYRKKPVIVEAKQLKADNAEDIARWCGGKVVTEYDAMDSDIRYVGLNIPTLEGVMRASQGDYVIKGVAGEYYPCKPGIFEATYDPI